MAEPEEPITHPKAKALAECCQVAMKIERKACAEIEKWLPVKGGRKMKEVEQMDPMKAWMLGVEDAKKDYALAIQARS